MVRAPVTAPTGARLVGLSFLRDARWFGRDRAVAYAKLIAVGYVPGLVIFYQGAVGKFGGDFVAFWSAARLALAGNAAGAYSPATQSAFQAALGRDHFSPFLNPPPFLALIAPFGVLPFAWALPAWVASTFALYLLVARRLLPNGTWPIAVFSAGYINALYGQNGFVTAALFIGAVLMLERRPLLAGLLFGALVIKPHLALLVPVALAAGRQWRAFGAAAISTVALLAGAYFLFGPQTTRAFLDAAPFTTTVLSDSSAPVTWLFSVIPKTPSVFAMARALGAPDVIAIVVQGVLDFGLCAVVWRLWAGPGEVIGKGAVLAACAVLATPYLFNYDLVVQILPICWLAREGMRRGFWPWERALLALVYWAPFVAVVTMGLGVDLAFFSSLLLLWMLLRRWYRGTPAGAVEKIDPQIAAA